MKLKSKIFITLLLVIATNVALGQTITISNQSYPLDKTGTTLLRNVHFSDITKFKLSIPNSTNFKVRFGPFNVKGNPGGQSLNVWCNGKKEDIKTLLQYDKTTLDCTTFYVDIKKLNSLKVLIIEVFGGTNLYLIEIYPD